MENRNSKRVTKDQKYMLVQYLEDHREFAHDRFVNGTGSKSLAEQWNHLAEKLNAYGGSMKDGEGWKRARVNMRSKAKQKSQDLRNAMERSGVNSSITEKHLSNLDENIIGVMTTVAVVGQREVSEPLRSSGAVTSVELFDASVDHFEIEFLEGGDEEPQMAPDVVPQDPLPPQRRAPKRKNYSLEESNAKMIQLEERRVVLAERKIAALEKRNSIEKRKADVLSNILNKLDLLLQR
ncbi:uncharacterized protein LOC118751694 [Rhagoletis pomonella]|uniref:uncharacterized protein LOC118751694 n=1 Tax=Rhagoletis pomonella TaxID=28610 RepID=UPI001780EFBF|nr:uncharacterized protein LOC118751694 [Rhagoletis pomonella]XP_036342400.1 uncharacterized protein LOC118751694 [Rhagoletis pomonella]XP_036342401.1 uncharacterized protein LOC118751694 [Rhagoletis pomonella]